MQEPDVVSVLRETLGAIDNAEAADASAAPSVQAGVIAGGVSGLGAGEVPRKVLTPEEVHAIVEREVQERRDASVAGSLSKLIAEASACTLCAKQLPHAPRPVFKVQRGARVLLVGQAPGAKVHASGTPWDDASGDHLREWLGVDRATFDSDLFAILPMGFCWPGRREGGDLPPRPECAPAWHDRLRAHLPKVELTLLIGLYAQDHYLRDRQRDSLTESVRAFETYLPEMLPLPHPSWRSKLWMKKNPWFARRVLPMLQRRIAALVISG